MRIKTVLLLQPAVLIILFFLIVIQSGCSAGVGKTVLSKPDEYVHKYEAREKFVLRAIAKVFEEKGMGTCIRVDEGQRRVISDYLIRNDWRTKSTARVKSLNWKETEVSLSVVTEKKTENGWEMRRLLENEQYMKLFDTIDLKIYEEMYKID